MADGPENRGGSPEIDVDEKEKPAGQPAGSEDLGIRDLISKLISDARVYAHAEVELLRISYARTVHALWVSALAVIVGGILCLAAFVSLLVGMTIALSANIGTLLAALVVSLIAGGVGCLIALLAGRRFGALVSALLPRNNYAREQVDDIRGSSDDA